MRKFSLIAAGSSFALALAACGGASEEAAEPAEAAEPVEAEPAAEEEEAAEDVAEEEATVDSEEAAVEEAATQDAAAEAVVEEVAAAPMAPPAAFAQCTICHQVEPGAHGIGPSLAGVYGQPSARLQDFSYTPAMSNANLTWDEATLDTYLADPFGTVPGTNMALGPISASDRAEIIAYLKTL